MSDQPITHYQVKERLEEKREFAHVAFDEESLWTGLQGRYSAIVFCAFSAIKMGIALMALKLICSGLSVLGGLKIENTIY